MAKVLLILRYLDIPTRPSRELQLWNLVSRSELIVLFFRWFFFLVFCSSYWNLYRPKMQIDPFTVPISSIFQLILYSLNSSYSFSVKVLRQFWVYSLMWFVVRSIYVFCAPLTENVAVRLHLVFFIVILYLFWMRRWKITSCLQCFLSDIFRHKHQQSQQFLPCSHSQVLNSYKKSHEHSFFFRYFILKN